MSETSRLSIVVDTQQAKQKLIDFTAQLKTATTQATNLATQLRAPMGAAGANAASTSLAGLTAQAAKAQLQQDKLTQSAAKTAIQQQKLAQEVIKTSIAQNNLARSAQAVVIGNQRAEASARRAASGITALSSATNTLNRNWANINLSARTFTPATAAARALSVQINSVTAAAARVAPAANNAAAGLNNLNSASQRADRSARGLHGTMNKLYTVLNSGLVAVTGLGFIKTAAEMQNLNNQIRLVTDSEHEYLLMKQLAGKIADENFADINSTISLYQKSVRALENLGKSQADSIKFTEAVSLAMRTGGRSAGENAAAILQLGQAMGAGVIMGDEFRSISENAPILLKLVAKEMGVLQGDLKKLSADGKITAEIMYNAMTKNMAELEQLAKKMPLTMGQAFVVAKNNYKKYTDELMNSTGGVSDKISGMLVKISANFDTIAKVGIAAVSVGLLSIVANLATATKAMALFNLVASANPLILIVSGFLLLTSAIYGTNEVLTVSGIVVGDFFDEMGIMIGDAKSWWDELGDKIKERMGTATDDIADANDKNAKNFLGFYKNTEEGFAGLIQNITAFVGSFDTVIRSIYITMSDWLANLFIGFENLGRAAHNASQNVRDFFGFSSETVPYMSFQSADFIGTMERINQENLDAGRSYAKSLTKRSQPTVPFGQYDPNAPLKQSMVNQNFFSVDMTNFMKKGVGSGVLARTAKSPTQKENPLLYNPQANRFPSAAGENALIQKGVSDLKAAEEERLKVLKKQEEELKKQERLAKSLGDTLVSNTNLKGLPLKGGIGGQATAGGMIKGYTAEFAQAAYAGMGSDVKYFSGFNDKFHAGTNSKHATGSAFDLVLKDPSKAKKAAAALREYADQYGYSIKVLDEYANPSKNATGGHLHVSVLGRKKGADGADIAYLKQVNSERNRERESQIREAEKQREKEAQEAEKRLQSRLKIDKEYATKRELISLQLNEKLLEIREAGYDEETAVKRGDQAVAEANREMAIYDETLKRRVDALDDFHQTERYKLQQERDNAVFDALHNQDLLQAGNEQYLKYEIEAANRTYKHKESLLNLSQEEEALGLFEYASTDRRMFEEGWRLKIARAKLATDELKDIRIKAYEAEYAKDQELFNLNEKKKLLSLREGGMGAGEYMLANQQLNIQGINDSTMTPEEKRLEANAARQPLNDALTGIMSEINPQSENERIEQEHKDRLEILDAYESQYTSLVGVQSAERIAIEQSYQEAKRDLMITKGGETLSDLTMLSKAFLGEQSSLYKGLFAMEKAYTLASVLMKNQEAISKAWASAPFPYNLGAVASTVAGTAGIASAVAGIVPQGFEKGGYTGSMGTKDIAGVVHGQEYVFDAQATKRIGVDNLNAMRKGQSVGGDVQVNIINNSSARVTASDDGQTITIEDVRNENKRAWTNLSNPNSFESKQVNRNIQAPRRR